MSSPRVFGCVCLIHSFTPRQEKHSTKATKCVFLCYSRLQRGYTLLIHIDTLSLPMSHFLRTLLCSLSTTLPILMSYLYPFFIPSRIPHMYLQLLHLNHCMFILITRILTSGPQLTHLLWQPPPRSQSYRLPMIFPLPFRKIFVPLVTLILFIIS